MKFTHRELQVMRRKLVDGMGYHAISSDLGLSVTRVRQIWKNVLLKLARAD